VAAEYRMMIRASSFTRAASRAHALRRLAFTMGQRPEQVAPRPRRAGKGERRPLGRRRDHSPGGPYLLPAHRAEIRGAGGVAGPEAGGNISARADRSLDACHLPCKGEGMKDALSSTDSPLARPSPCQVHVTPALALAWEGQASGVDSREESHPCNCRQ